MKFNLTERKQAGLILLGIEKLPKANLRILRSYEEIYKMNQKIVCLQDIRMKLLAIDFKVSFNEICLPRHSHPSILSDKTGILQSLVYCKHYYEHSRGQGR